MFPIRDNIPSKNKPTMTRWLILINLLVFVIELLLQTKTLEQSFRALGVIPNIQGTVFSQPLLPHNYLAFISHMFLHGGWGHVIGNLWTLWIFGDNVEDRMGPRGFLLFYILCGLGAITCHIWMQPNSTIPVVGASGAISGVMGAYFILYPRAQILMLFPIFFIPYFFSISAFVYLGFWLFFQFIQGAATTFIPGQVGGIAWWAHVGGFVTGLSLFIFFVKPRPNNPDVGYFI